MLKKADPHARNPTSHLDKLTFWIILTNLISSNFSPACVLTLLLHTWEVEPILPIKMTLVKCFALAVWLLLSTTCFMMSSLIWVRSPYWPIVCYKWVPYLRANLGSYSHVYIVFGLILHLNSQTLCLECKRNHMELEAEKSALHAKIVLQ